MRSYAIAIVACLSAHVCEAYIYDLRVLQRTVPGTKRNQYVIGFGDFHARSCPTIIDEQRKMLNHLIQQADKSQVRFFVEDLSSPNTQGIFSCAQYRANTRGGFLGGITDDIKQAGCAIDNLEFRYCRVAALGLTVAGNTGKEALAMQEALKIEHFLNESRAHLARTKLFKDASVAHWYTAQKKTVEAMVEKLSLRPFQYHSVRAYLQSDMVKIPKKNRVEELLSYDSALFDMHLVHDLLNDTKHSTLVVLAGGSHVHESFSVLVTAGYKRLDITQESLILPKGSTKTALDVQGPKTLSLPTPIALTTSKMYWPQKRS